MTFEPALSEVIGGNKMRIYNLPDWFKVNDKQRTITIITDEQNVAGKSYEFEMIASVEDTDIFDQNPWIFDFNTIGTKPDFDEEISYIAVLPIKNPSSQEPISLQNLFPEVNFDNLDFNMVNLKNAS